MAAYPPNRGSPVIHYGAPEHSRNKKPHLPRKYYGTPVTHSKVHIQLDEWYTLHDSVAVNW